MQHCVIFLFIQIALGEAEWWSIYQLLRNGHHICLDKAASSHGSILRKQQHSRHSETAPDLLLWHQPAAPHALTGSKQLIGLRSRSIYGAQGTVDESQVGLQCLSIKNALVVTAPSYDTPPPD